MHVHGSHLDPNAMNLYSAVAAEKTASAKRAAEVRKKLMASASEMEGSELDADAISLIGDESQENRRSRREKDSLSSEKNQNPESPADNPEPETNQSPEDVTDHSGPEDPISMWG
jgi:hypothetical protein